MFEISFLSIYCHTAVVSYMLAGSRSTVKQRRLAAIGIAYQCDIDDMPLMMIDFAGLNVFDRRRRCCHSPGAKHCGFLGRHLDHLDKIGFRTTQRHFITHDIIFDWIAQRCMEHDRDSVAFHETHFNQSFPESSVTQNLNHDAGFTGV